MIRLFRATWLPTLFTFCMWVATLITWGTMWSLVFIVATLLGMADVRARVRDYVTAKAQLGCCRIRGPIWTPSYYYVVDHKKVRAFLYRYRTSRCQRNAASCAAYDVGLGNLGREYFYELGYRWYHVLPDGTFSKKCPYFRITFYRNLLGL